MAEVEVILSTSQLEETFGVLFIGYVVSMVAYGFTFFRAFVSFGGPYRSGIKAMVACICILDTINSALISHTLFHYLVVHFPLTTGLIRATRTYCAQIGLSSLAVVIVQLYYSYRIWNASKNALMTCLAVLLSISAFALGLVVAVKLVINPSLLSLSISGTKTIMISSHGFTALSGIISFAALSLYPQPAHSPLVTLPKTGFRGSFPMYTASRGLLVIALELCLLITFASTPAKPIWMTLQLVASKVFINSLLTMLNSRDIYRGQGLHEEDVITHRNHTFSASGPQVSSNFIFVAMDGNDATDSTRSTRVKVSVDKAVYHDETD